MDLRTNADRLDARGPKRRPGTAGEYLRQIRLDIGTIIESGRETRAVIGNALLEIQHSEKREGNIAAQTEPSSWTL